MIECKNSMSGKHELVDQIGKNKGKNVCKYCLKLLPKPKIYTGEDVTITIGGIPVKGVQLK